MCIRPTGGWVRLGDEMDVKVWKFPPPGETRWVLSVNGFIIRIDAEEGVIRQAAEAYFRRASEIRAGA